jgi:dimethylhistidine N-methyltransferase
MTTITLAENVQTTEFGLEILQGLKTMPKHLPSKYFYDDTGDRIFQEIMHCEEYYPFACEMEIFRRRTTAIATAIARPCDAFDLIELGPGDCKKSAYLLRYLMKTGTRFTYIPIDISSNVINLLQTRLPEQIPGLKICGFNGEYLPMIKAATKASGRRKVVLFLGSNLGNMTPAEARIFCRKLRCHLSPGDLVLIGLDLKKYPSLVLAAYNDKAGITKRFNLNLLERINRELNADFDIDQFEHFPVYDEASGACKSYLVSQTDQEVTLWCNGEKQRIRFARNEEIFMEISQKYRVDQVDHLACQAFFKPVQHFFDELEWFVDALWCAV